MIKKYNVRWQLVFYDILILAFVDTLLLALYRSNENLSFWGVTCQSLLSFVCVFVSRFFVSIYKQIWRYGGIQCYIRLLAADAVAFIVNLFFEKILPIEHITFARLIAISSMNLLGALSIRMIYRYLYKCENVNVLNNAFLRLIFRVFAGSKVILERKEELNKIKIAIIGAGRMGVALAEELISDETSPYMPCCFVDNDKNKIGKVIHGIPVLTENKSLFDNFNNLEIQEVVFAISELKKDEEKRLCDMYLNAGYRIKTYGFSNVQVPNGKPRIRSFDIEELLFRKPIIMKDDKTNSYYRDKVILITGGGGSIGSEICRQLAKTQPKKIIILDIYENGAYDVQQELKIAYGDALDLQIEITSITNKKAMRKVFETCHPQIVINAAAHKHVPLMEHNCIEAVENNVFGTMNLVELCEEYNTERFMMVSTDKAVNPTNVMGATKRMCEMIVQSASTYGKVKYSATRFGNVLGSAGSVIPLFKKQISNGGPVTLTDKRIIRYFMTIPEASQLVLQSGAMANNGELFVLDMGQPVKIYDLATNMIRLSGARGIEIVETGLRPGEKLYEELLVKTEELDKTDNDLIFIERELPAGKAEVDEKLEKLKKACETNDDDLVREVLKEVVPTFRTPEEINSCAEIELEPARI